MSPTIRGPDRPQPDDSSTGQRRLESASSRQSLGGGHGLEESLASFINAVHGWPGALRSPDARSGEPGSSTFARLGAIEEWTLEASKAAARMESKVLWSLLALESRISQSQDESREAKRQMENAPALLWQALEELKAQSQEVAGRTESKFLSSMETLEERVAQSQQDSTESRRLVQEIPALIWQALQELKALSADVAARAEERILRALESVGSRVAGASEDSALAENILIRLESIDERLSGSGSGPSDGSVDLAARMQERIVRSLEAVDTRIGSARENSAQAEERILGILASVEGRLEATERAFQAHDLILNSLEAVEGRLDGSGAQAAHTRDRLLLSLEALESRMETWGEGAAKIEQITAKALGDIGSRLAGVDEQAAAARAEAAGTAQSIEDQVLPALSALDQRTAQLEEKVLAGGRQIDQIAAVASDGLKNLTAAERHSSQLLDGNLTQVRELRTDVAGKLKEVQSNLNTRLENLERKVDSSVRTSLSNWERFLETLELLEHKFSSIMRSIEESRAQAQSAVKRSDERTLRALESLEASIAQLHGASVFPTRSPRLAESDRHGQDGPKGRREDRLVAIMLNPAGPSGPAGPGGKGTEGG
ncbi:MAG: hypothetical protein ACT4OM_10065 [Actinomycetota bacterium]